MTKPSTPSAAARLPMSGGRNPQHRGKLRAAGEHHHPGCPPRRQVRLGRGSPCYALRFRVAVGFPSDREQLLRACQRQYPGHSLLWAQQDHASASLVQRPGRQRQRPYRRRIREPQPRCVYRQLPYSAGQLSANQRAQLPGAGEIRLPGQHDHRAGFPGRDRCRKHALRDNAVTVCRARVSHRPALPLPGCQTGAQGGQAQGRDAGAMAGSRQRVFAGAPLAGCRSGG